MSIARHLPLLVASALTAGIALVPQSAQAGRDMRGRFGLGGQRTLGGYNQLHAKYFVIKHLSLGLGWGFLVVDNTDDDLDPVVGTSISPEVLGWFPIGPQESPIGANLGIGGRFDIVVVDAGTGDTYFEFDIEIPVIAEVYLGDHFGVAPEVGLVIGVNDNDEVLFGVGQERSSIVGNALGFGIADNFGMFAGGSFHFYF